MKASLVYLQTSIIVILGKLIHLVLRFSIKFEEFVATNGDSLALQKLNIVVNFDSALHFAATNYSTIGAQL